MEKLVKTRLVIAVLFMSCLLCIGCGGGSSTASVPYSSIASGNWSLTATSTVTSGFVLDMAGSLTQSGNVVSGNMFVYSSVSDCPSLPSVAIPFTGKFSGDTLTLTSANFSNQFVTVNAVGSGNSLTGTYSIKGGCADGDNGTIVASYLPPLTGTWTGTFTNPDGTPIPVDPSNPIESATASLQLTQSPTATNGSFTLSGSFNTNFAPGSYCFTSGTIPGAGSTTGASVTGTAVVISAVSDNGVKIVYVGPLDGPAKMMLIQDTYTPGASVCKMGAFLNLVQQR
jgi:hypothetical protein